MDKQTMILIVDDDPGIRETLSDILEINSLRNESCGSGAEALRLAGSRGFDIALIDLKLPDMDGIDVILGLKKINPEIICAIITGNASIQNAIKSLRLGADDYFVKPLYPEKLLHFIEEAIDKKKVRQSLVESDARLRQSLEIQKVINFLLHLSLKELTLKQMMEQSLARILSVPWIAFEEKGAIFLVDDSNSSLEMFVSQGLAPELLASCNKVLFGHCLCGRAASQQKTQFVSCIDESHETTYDGITPHGHYCVPIMYGGRCLGVINIYVKEGHVRSSWESDFLQAVADTMAGIIMRNQMDLDKKRLEVQLRQGQKMEAIGTLAGGIAHDFNNILTAILGFTDLVIEELPPDSMARKDLDHVLQAGKRARDLVRQILAFSRQAEHEKQPLQISLVVKEAMKLLRASIPTTIEFREQISTESLYVLSDPTQIHQIVMNLCTNAFHAMRDKGGVLDVRLEVFSLAELPEIKKAELPPGRYLRLSVIDTGSGMTRMVMERIFEPYFTTKSAQEGTGLGLAVVYGIVKGMGGLITVDSEVGVGTTFRVYLPVYEDEIGKIDAPQVEVSFGGNENILAVDDEEPIALLIQRILERFGYRVTCRTSSVEALALFRQDPARFDLVVTDQIMPNMTGINLSREVRKLRPDIPIILITGFSDLVSPDIIKAIGNAELITKPIIGRKLAGTVRKFLDK